MRYHQGASPEQLGAPVGQEMVIGAAVLGLLLGIGFVVAGLRGRQLWITAWGGGLVAASLTYLGAAALGVV
jgi:hypothetical protein